eukprot:10490-Heterococcus_DN1.PRE.3
MLVQLLELEHQKLEQTPRTASNVKFFKDRVEVLESKRASSANLINGGAHCCTANAAYKLLVHSVSRYHDSHTCEGQLSQICTIHRISQASVYCTEQQHNCAEEAHRAGVVRRVICKHPKSILIADRPGRLC